MPKKDEHRTENADWEQVKTRRRELQKKWAAVKKAAGQSKAATAKAAGVTKKAAKKVRDKAAKARKLAIGHQRKAEEESRKPPKLDTSDE